jgi:type IX secretion system PorP/SprF family membrane protein
MAINTKTQKRTTLSLFYIKHLHHYFFSAKMKSIKIKILLFLLIIASGELKSQDFQFSQFYNVPLYMNPAFAGSLHKTRVSFHQRLQWPKLDARYTTSVLSADKYFANYKSGGGIIIMQDYQGGGQISSTEVQLMYSYEIILNRKFTFRPGLQVGYVSRHLDYTQLRFPHQYDNQAGLIRDADNADLWKRAKGYSDVSAGGVLYSKNFWAGFAAHHINSPNQSFKGTGNVSKLPTQFSFVSGYKIVLYKQVSLHNDKKEVSITPTFQYKWQGKSDQLDLGIYGAANQGLVGIWYRGIPVKHYTDSTGQKFQNNESIIAFVGWKGEAIRIGYSYDFVISRLARAGTGGAHELNITYVFEHKKHKKRKIMKRLPCPSF